MSKASEWAHRRKHGEPLRTDIRPVCFVGARGERPMRVAEVTNAGQFYYCCPNRTLTPEEALGLARWITDIYGERKRLFTPVYGPGESAPDEPADTPAGAGGEG